MGTYTLKNDLVLNVQFTRPSVSPGTPPSVVYDNSDILNSKLRYTTREIDPNTGHDVAPCIQFNVEVDAPNATPAQLPDHTIRMMQLIRIEAHQANYYGAKPADGYTTWFLKGRFLNTILDCLTTTGKEPQPLDFPFYSSTNTEKVQHGYFADLQDSPAAIVPLVLVNRDNKNQYLSGFFQSMRFQTIVVFIHKDGTREPLECCRWNCERNVSVVWHDGKPSISGTPVSNVTVPIVGEPVLGRLDLTRFIASGPGQVMNVAGKRALDNLRSDPDVSYVEVLGQGATDRPGNFWIWPGHE
jgi:hypothetical protein